MPVEDPLNATLIERIDLNPELAIFRVALESGEPLDFQPGQYTTLGVLPPEDSGEEEADPDAKPKRRRKGRARLLRRAYSIASAPGDPRGTEFYLVVVPEGKLTPQLWDLQEGDRLFMDETPKGTFTLDGVPEGKTLVTIATGTGLAPFVSMLETYRGTGRWDRFVVIHGTRLAADLGYRERLEELADEDESIVYLPACTREPETSNWQGLRGRVHVILEPEMFQDLTHRPLKPESCHVFLCGNPAMIDQCEAELTARGFATRDRKNPEGNIHLERYW